MYTFIRVFFYTPYAKKVKVTDVIEKIYKNRANENVG
jgi:hypothetical protein